MSYKIISSWNPDGTIALNNFNEYKNNGEFSQSFSLDKPIIKPVIAEVKNSPKPAFISDNNVNNNSNNSSSKALPNRVDTQLRFAPIVSNSKKKTKTLPILFGIVILSISSYFFFLKSKPTPNQSIIVGDSIADKIKANPLLDEQAKSKEVDIKLVKKEEKPKKIVSDKKPKPKPNTNNDISKTKKKVEPSNQTEIKRASGAFSGTTDDYKKAIIDLGDL